MENRSRLGTVFLKLELSISRSGNWDHRAEDINGLVYLSGLKWSVSWIIELMVKFGSQETVMDEKGEAHPTNLSNSSMLTAGAVENAIPSSFARPTEAFMAASLPGKSATSTRSVSAGG